MGIIGRQSTRAVFFSYLGTGIGFISVGVLYPKLLTPSQIGLINIIIAFSLIFGQLGTFGFANVISRMFTYFRDKNNHHRGFPFVMVLVIIAGSVIISLLILIFKELILRQNVEESNLLYQYYYMLIPASIAVLIYNLMDAYGRSLYDAVIATFHKEFIYRIFVLILIGLFAIYNFSFKWFMISYLIVYIFPSFALIWVFYIRKDFKIKPDFSLLNKAMVRSMANISIYALIGGFGSIAIASVDKIMINKLLGLAETGIYSIAFLFGTVLRIPAAALGKSSYGIIADAWKNKDFNLIELVYHKSCLNQLIVGLVIFLLIWLNIDFLFGYLPPEYEEGKYVILFLSLAQLINMATGVNSVMLVTSDYYKFHTYLTGILLVALVITNYIFIPMYGITGAALGSAITLLATNIIRFILFLVKYKMQPYNYKFIVVLLIGAITYGGFYILPEMNNHIINLLINGSFILIVYGTLILITKVSEDINAKMRDYYYYVQKIIKKA